MNRFFLRTFAASFAMRPDIEWHGWDLPKMMHLKVYVLLPGLDLKKGILLPAIFRGQIRNLGNDQQGISIRNRRDGMHTGSSKLVHKCFLGILWPWNAVIVQP